MDESPVSSSREKVLRLREQQEVLELFDEGAVIVDRAGGIFLRIVRLVFFSELRKRAIFPVFGSIFREMSADFGIGS
ncbi:MAG TPA: hypothetical protein VK041_09280 [Opitutales bacterium]|nr:hypothetical protein [Opitutales bacterium]